MLDPIVSGQELLAKAGGRATTQWDSCLCRGISHSWRSRQPCGLQMMAGIPITYCTGCEHSVVCPPMYIFSGHGCLYFLFCALHPGE